MKHEDIRCVELALQKLGNARGEKDGEEAFNEFFKAICEASGMSISGDPLKRVFNEVNNEAQQGFIAACMLRALNENFDVFMGKRGVEVRRKTAELFDRSISSYYRRINVLDSDTYLDKLSKSQKIVEELYSEAEDLDKSIRNLSSISQAQGSLMKMLSVKNYTSFLLGNFIEEKYLDKENIKDFFELAKQYKNTETIEESISLFDEVKEKFGYFSDGFREEKKINGLGFKCFFSILGKVYHLIEDDFNSNEEIVPTSLSAKLSERKYPFHVRNGDVRIKVSISNTGSGRAFDVRVFLEYDSDFLEIEQDEIAIGSLSPDKTIDVVFKGIIVSESNSIQSEAVLVKALWNNFGGSEGSVEFIGELVAQSPDIDWQSLSEQKPYVLEAVESEKELVGRTELLVSLQAKLTSNQLESSIIYGQKRVGKTSIAKTIKNIISKIPDYTVIFLSIGDLDKTSCENFVSSLGEEICFEIEDSLALDLQPPEFKGAISPLVRHFKKIKKIKPERKFVIIIDEFDEIPSELYRYTPIGDTFFHNIRSLSSESQIAFLLVGGENMQIIKQSTDRLNKFENFSVDYFDRGKFWNDFQELVRNPVRDVIEFNDDSVVRLYELTEGNPFLTKLICGKAFSKACDVRNAYISADEIEEAFYESLSSVEINNVNHFWMDGILEDDSARIDQVQTQRRKFLLAYADIKRAAGEVDKDSLLESNFMGSSVAVEPMIESFSTRNILIEEDNGYRCKPRFFESWLIGKGYQSITSTFLDSQAIEDLKSKEAKARVEESEIIQLCKSWGGLYRGTELTATHVRTWLNQFDNNIERRLMFKLLQSLRFYNEVVVREKLRIIHEHVRKDLVQDIKIASSRSEKVSRNVLVSAFGKISKSGPSYVRMYATENKISKSENIISFEKICTSIQNNERIKAVVFIDDITASGQTAVEHLEKLNEQCGELLANRGIKVVPAFICGFEEGLEQINSIAEGFSFEVDPYISDILMKSDQCFSEESDIFEQSEEFVKAREIAYKYGTILLPNMPLGYQDNQLLIAFFETCPNNSLPILWAEQPPKWTALFRRR